MTCGRGFIHVYTGDGKGKTTAAMGLALRAAGQGLRVVVLQFLKGTGTGEAKSASHVPGLTVRSVAPPVLVAREGEIDADTLREWGDRLVVFPPGQPPDWLVKEVAAGLESARKALTDGSCDLLVLDELSIVLHYGLAEERQVLDMVRERAPSIEVVITGRNAPQSILDVADLVTEMVQRKHYFEQGVPARKGVEF